MEDVKVILGDCLEELPKIESGSVEVVITDIPFGTTDCSWDSVIPFDFMWKELNRIVKPRGSILLFGTEPFSTKLRSSNFEMYKYDYIWVKTKVSGFMNAKNKPLNTFENVMVFSEYPVKHKSLDDGNRMNYYPQGLIPCSEKVKGTRKFDNDDHRFSRPSNKETYVKAFKNYPSNVLFFDSVFFTKHPTQKPVDLIEHLIKTYTKEGETVLDFTAGVLTTGIACYRTNRKAILIEKEKKYYDIGLELLQEEINKPKIKKLW